MDFQAAWNGMSKLGLACEQCTVSKVPQHVPHGWRLCGVLQARCVATATAAAD